MAGHYVINCNNKQNGKPRVCKNYFSKKHKSHRKKWSANHGKYQSYTNVKRKKKKSIITSEVPQPIVVVPPATGAKIKKRITPTLVSGVAPAQPQVFGTGATGQRTFQNAINRIESRANNSNGVDTDTEFGFVSKPHKKNYGTGPLRYNPKTGLVMPKNNKYKNDYE